MSTATINLGNDLDVRCARACRLEILVNDRPMYMIPNHDRAWLLPPSFSSDHAWSHMLEDEIERRGLWRRYIQSLCLIIGVDEPYCVSDEREWLEFSEPDIALLVRATPDQKARAFVAVVSS